MKNASAPGLMDLSTGPPERPCDMANWPPSEQVTESKRETSDTAYHHF